MFSVPDDWVSAVIDVRPWVDRKLRAIAAHRSEVVRGALPGRLAALPESERTRLVATEWYVRYGAVGPTAPRTTL